MYKTILLFTFCATTLLGQRCFAQPASDDIENVKSFFQHYINFSEQNKNAKNDTIINLFFIRDTLESRLNEEKVGCALSKLNIENINLLFHKGYVSEIDSVFKSGNERNIYYLILRSSDVCMINSRSYAYYEWYKISLTGDRYFIVPGHGNSDTCYSIMWAFISCYNR